MSGLFLFAMMTLQVPVGISAAGEESIDNLSRCDNFYCEFDITKGDVISSSLEDFDLSTLNEVAKCKVRWWKKGDIEKYALDEVANYQQPVMFEGKPLLNGFIPFDFLSDGFHSLVVTSNAGQIFSRENKYHRILTTPLNLAGQLGSPAGEYIRSGEQGRFLILDRDKIESDRISFRITTAKQNPGAAELEFTLDSAHGMSASRLDIRAPNAVGVAKVHKFKRFNDAWFPELVTYSQRPASREDQFEAIVVKVNRLDQLKENPDLSINLKKGVILNNNIEDHQQITLENDKIVKLSDLRDLHALLSQPDTDSVRLSNRPRPFTYIRLLIGAALFAGIFFLLLTSAQAKITCLL